MTTGLFRNGFVAVIPMSNERDPPLKLGVEIRQLWPSSHTQLGVPSPNVQKWRSVWLWFIDTPQIDRHIYVVRGRGENHQSFLGKTDKEISCPMLHDSGHLYMLLILRNTRLARVRRVDSRTMVHPCRDHTELCTKYRQHTMITRRGSEPLLHHFVRLPVAPADYGVFAL
ncbi:hypothetical protein EV401DRAFT_1598017 [Pisolithus croceorrhizus]|nr:hypothetical protein EV401DRAFT_1598017 [Pisolithus croceorrhizus]